ncbi:hypothetical protein ACIOWG_14050 [Streptomyces sp. NPDC087658]|uniref:hypothetical protein n=1 Tax=Streptomyces sp. NPDC087658 TaxID=3365800 RepID=UPI0038202EF0
MNNRHIAAGLAVAALLAASACEAPREDDTKSASRPSPSADKDTPRDGAGIPKDPTGQDRAAYLDGLRSIDPWFVTAKGEDDAIDNGVNQCSGLDSEKPIRTAQQRFGTPDHPVNEADAAKINELVRRHICP